MPITTPRLDYQEVRKIIEHEPEFIPFRNLLLNEALLKFIYFEKCCYSGEIQEDRVIKEYDFKSEVSKDIGGFKVNTNKPDDAFSPDKFKPFAIKGIWLPIEACHVFTTLDDFQACPLIKDDNKKVLFLIHPHSESVYQPLLDNPLFEPTTCFALSLSSFRSLLVATPNRTGEFDFSLVKVSLDQEIEGVRRLLSMQECKLSIANTAILNQKMQERIDEKKEILPISFMNDVLSYVPKGYEDVGGMLYRSFPECLHPSQKTEVMPLLALYGVRNRDLFAKIVVGSDLSLTEFLSRDLLAPLAKIISEFLYHHQISIQAHGQNLSLILHNNKIIGFLYRDMGGVNQNITSLAQKKALPLNLQDYDSYSYIKNHIKDAKLALEEHFVQRALFPLTKQLCKTRQFFDDSRFKDWFDFVKSHGLLENWTTTMPDSLDDDHTVSLSSRQAFCRYGYVEGWFARMLLDYLKNAGIANDKELEDFDRHFSLPEQLEDGTIVPPCSNIRFFESVADFLVEKGAKICSQVEPCFVTGYKF